MQAVYILGGAGSGKSTFTSKLLQGKEFGPLEDLDELPNKKNIVTLRGHQLLPGNGMYLGVKREVHPGTDGLDRASSPVGEKWLREGYAAGDLPGFLVAEGATLATKRFLGALADTSELLLVHLHCPPEEAVRRFAERGSNQSPAFVEATRTRSANRFEELATANRSGFMAVSCDTSQEGAADLVMDVVDWHLHQ